MSFENTPEYAKKLDAADELKYFRSRFYIPQHRGEDCIYFTGNSLGLQPKTVRSYIETELEDWASMGVEGHFHARNPWYSYHEMFPGLLSKIVGGKPEEIVVMNGLTVNLHLLMASFYRPTKERFRIICEAKAFPSDQYAMESQVSWHGFHPGDAIIEVGPRQGEEVIRQEDILSAIQHYGNSVALVLFSGVNYYNGQVFPMQEITAAAHQAGAYAGFDLAHAAGNIELDLHKWNVDFACWCSYKYLNSGPGGVAGIYIHEKHVTDPSIPRLAGWWGYRKEDRFQMKKGFVPVPTAEGWQLSNAPVLTMAAHKASLDLFEEAGMPLLVKKSRQLTGYLFFVLDRINEIHRNSIRIITPREEKVHGCQVSMLIRQGGKELFEKLTGEGVVADWREPDVIRIAPVPLYNTYEDVWKFGEIVERIIRSES
jgi:kynureninase